MQLLTVVGARPQFIKAAAVSRAIAATQGGERPIVKKILHTALRFDLKGMVMDVVQQLKLNPSHSRSHLYGDAYAAFAIVMLMKKARFDVMI